MLHGAELLIAAAVFAVLLALRPAASARPFAIALVMGIVVTIVFGTNVLNTIYVQIAEQFPATSDPGDISFAYRGGDRGGDLRHRSVSSFGARDGLMRDRVERPLRGRRPRRADRPSSRSGSVASRSTRTAARWSSGS